VAVSHRIARYDIVELLEPVDEHAAGERGGVLELYEDGTAMVELTSLRADIGVDRIIVAPLRKLRAVQPQ